ncbi:kinetochore complex Sim4 subunit Fta1-domain-containing protein [Colletotrichum navitas]|uniref:Kinetochore complex Sim4 subunit Fta1-domain-containing protein n=1 Tax=Colletotrichum navitas TaxID=681940 RepID=A0AAD8PYC2_9PEZI|nr:kinetochore complex Sim4 subunit Fta1-domain-containing protein [Colletotrichum navitas]KAK1590368.1 kinetochore complex Sim4 subunit Fta1-domain-containing protein [Colletotrichum navitas]
MPPRGRKRASEVEPGPQPESPSPSSLDDREPPPPFFNTTFSTHRASPLYVGANALTFPRLQTLSQRLRDTLVGDVVRGVQVGLEGSDSSLGRAGPLERVGIRWVGLGALLGGAIDADADLSQDLGGDVAGSNTDLKKRGLVFEIKYENALCTAVLLPALSDKTKDTRQDGLAANKLEIPGLLSNDSSDEGNYFLNLPLLLLRMPAPLKSLIVDFLSSTFDCRISSMRLGTKSLTSAWERWIQDAGLPSQGPLAKDMVLTLGFYVPPPNMSEGNEEQHLEGLGIKSIDVIIPAEELRRFVKEGQGVTNPAETSKRKSSSQGYEGDQRKRKRLAGGKADEGWGWVEKGNGEKPEPFLRALSAYLDKHLALNLFHPGVRVTKVACGGFVLSEGRVKVFSPPGTDDDDQVYKPIKNLIGDLIDSAVS